MTPFERCLKLLDECIEMQSKINTSLKVQKESLEDDLNSLVADQAERIANEKS